MAEYNRSVILILSAVWLAFVLGGCRKKAPAPSSPTGNGEPAGGEASLVIEPRVGVGQVKFGATADQVKQSLGEPSSTAASGAILVYENLGLTITLREGAVTAISCGDPRDKDADAVKACRCRTKEGIGIGSTEEEIIAAYGQPAGRRESQLIYSALSTRFVVVDGKVIGMWFQRPRR